ncbi:MAG: phosphodiester glycosidase family protein [Parasporobacterium sp.]|nr:phosphodiester glycosidase family protein [Parasporobacterium sp.]
MKILKTVGKVLLTVLVTLVILVVALLGVILLLTKGPSETAKVIFVRSVKETSAIGFLADMFLSADEVQQIMDSTQMKEMEQGTSDTSQIHIDETSEDKDKVEVIDVSGSTFKGKLMIVHDPSKVFCGTIPEFYEGQGNTVAGIIDQYNANGYSIVGGINGGDFYDAGANHACTALPLGIVISEGQYWSDHDPHDASGLFHIAGFNQDNVFVIARVTEDEIDSLNLRDAMFTVHETGPTLILNGEPMIDQVPDSATYGGGKNPRTVIGQRTDGTVLLLVVDGRQANSLGATFKDLVNVMMEYEAYNACAMDGGTSTQMVYQGEILNHPYSPSGPRKCPTAWLVKE